MKTKINVTVEQEESLQNQINEDSIKEILSKLKNNQSVFLMKKPFTTMIIKDDKMKLKKGKWFKKFKSIPLINIEKSFILENCQELILLSVNVGKFSGYIVLRITVASNLLDFIDILNKVLNHHHTIIPKGSVYYEMDDENTKVIIENKPISIEPDEIDQSHYINYKDSVDVVDSSVPVVNVIENEEKESLKSNDKDENYVVVEKNKILRLSNNTEEVTYLNNNSHDSFINDIGPIALFSQTFPSPYTISNDTNNCVNDSDSESESDSHSENGQQIM